MATKKNDGVNICMCTGCTRSPRSRGLCDVHYTYLASLVKKGQYQWENLIRSGVCLDTKRRPLNGAGLAAFLKEKGVKHGN